jgi:hypothetical protein
MDEVVLALQEFYYTPTTTGESISDFLCGSLLVEASARIKLYRLTDATPRPPTEALLGLTAFAAGGPYPSEVALCCSFYAERNLASQRGRVYLGPLNGGNDETSTDGSSRPSTILMNTINLSAERMAQRASSAVWCVLGRPGGSAALQPVTGGWVDNAWDTMRSRGPDPTTRVAWAST